MDWNKKHFDWCSLNLDPERFWNITPREVKREMAAAIHYEVDLKNRNAWLAWHVAVLSKIKKMPKLQDLLLEHESENKISKQPEAWEVSYAKMNVWAMTSKRKH